MKPAPLLLTFAVAAAAFSVTARAESEKTQPYELKNRSEFHSESDARIPFWPIGFQRPKLKADGTSTAPVVMSKIQLEPSHFNVTSILLGNPALATINGRSFEEGELLPVVNGTERLRVVVRAVRDGGVTLEHEGQQIFVPMKRPELGQKQSQQKAGAVEFTINIGDPKSK